MTGPLLDATGALVPSPAAAARRARPLIFQLARRKPLAFAGLIFLAIVVIVAFIGPYIAPHDALRGDLTAAMQGPSWEHWLGTDQLGRDTFSRLLVGTGPTMLYTSQVVAAAVITGVCLGMIAGFAGGIVDSSVMTVSDVLMSMPGMVMLLVILTIFQGNMPIAMLTIGVLISGFLMRVIRASTLTYRSETFVEAAAVSGLSPAHILSRHILPRQFGTVLVQASLLTGMALLLVTGVAYLGFGTEPPYPSWGLMIGDGAQIFGTQPWLMVSAGMAVAFTVLATSLLGDGLRDLTIERWSGRRVSRVVPRRLEHEKHGVEIESAATSDSLLSIEGLEISYGPAADATRVVHGIDLEVRAGSTVGLVGESGSGKTATARAILGVLRGGRITGGRILFDGKDVTRISEFAPAQRAALGIGYIAQEPHLSLDPAWRVGSQLVECLRRHDPHMPKAQARARALELLSNVKMRDPEATFQKYPFELSGGMAQRVAIARALCTQPRLLIADEPTTALDVTVQAEILDLLRDIQEHNGMAILIITHDWGVVADICDEAVVLRHGVVKEAAAVSEIFTRPQDPYTATLLASSPAGMPSRVDRTPRTFDRSAVTS